MPENITWYLVPGTWYNTWGLRRGGLMPTCGSAHARSGRGCRKIEPVSTTEYCQGVHEETSMVESAWAGKERKDPTRYTSHPDLRVLIG